MALSDKQKTGIKVAVAALVSAFAEAYSGIAGRLVDFVLSFF